LQKEADAIGYPVLIKAVAGGGGKGMRKVEKNGDFKAALQSAKREAASSFGDDRVLLEMYVQRPRHIEVQVFGDTHGNVVHLFERDCSLQRRHQKVIEEAPAPGMDDATRKAVTDAAVLAAKAVNYVGAGTIEFIADASEGLRADRIWFMEMNTRLQVEHPVTEEITGQDLVEWQLRVASGEKLPLKQEELKINGWAMEARLYAENPATGFLPSTGKLEYFELPKVRDGIDWYPMPDVRVDTGVTRGDEISPNYDPMIAKVIVHKQTRTSAIDTLREACGRFDVWPVKTNAGFLVRCLSDQSFIEGDVDTALIGARGTSLSNPPPPSDDVLACAAHEFARKTALPQPFGNMSAEAGRTPWFRLRGFRLNGRSNEVVRLRYAGEPVAIELSNRGGKLMYVGSGGHLTVFDRGEAYEFTLDTGERSADEAAAGDGAILSPMPGKIVSVAAKAGAKLKKGDPILVLEAMKMEHTLTAPFDGKLTELNAKPGAQVSEGVLLAKLERD
jgi:3-methylcrotonyl-CoA carboxylase alpha subunit